MRTLRIWLSLRALRLSQRIFSTLCECPQCESQRCNAVVFVDEAYYDDDRVAGFMCRYCMNGHYWG